MVFSNHLANKIAIWVYTFCAVPCQFRQFSNTLRHRFVSPRGDMRPKRFQNKKEATGPFSEKPILADSNQQNLRPDLSQAKQDSDLFIIQPDTAV